MKSNIIYSLIALVFSVFIMSGCQEPVVIINDSQNGSSIDSTSPLADLVQQTTMNDGSFDNIIDKSSCTTVKLPVTVVANGVEIVVNTVDDYKLIEREFDKSSTDVDVLEIIFPITVVFADFSEKTISNGEQLVDVVKDCIEGGADSDIECIDFVYPIDLSVFNVITQVYDVVTVNNDEELYQLFDSLDEQKVVSFNFPILVRLAGDSTMIEIKNNDELEQLIEDFNGTCDEDDDNDYNDDDIDDTEFVGTLLKSSWAITYYFDKVDETTGFDGFIFTFHDKEMAKATKGDLMIEGEWEANGDDGTLELELNFGSDAPFEGLDEGWSIIEYDSATIKLTKHHSDGSEKALTFNRVADNPGITENALATIITDGEWKIASYLDSAGIDNASDYTGFNLSFFEDGSVMAIKGTETINGTWSEFSGEEENKLVLDFGSNVPFDKISDDWHVKSITETSIELTTSDDTSTSTLVIEKL